jgi:hypothetical protein
MKLPGQYVFRKKLRCLHCAAPFDACQASDGKPSGPEPGDVSVCAYCGRLAVFDADLRLREMTPAEDQRLKTIGSGFPRAMAEASVEDYHMTMPRAIFRAIFDDKEDI